jgi:hypothetical protein
MVVTEKLMTETACDRLRENFQQLNTAANMTFHWVIFFVIPVVIDFLRSWACLPWQPPKKGAGSFL